MQFYRWPYSLHTSCCSAIMLCLGWFFGLAPTLWAVPPTDSNPAEVPLEQVQDVLINALALTERGVQDSTTLQNVVSNQLAQAGFNPVLDAKSPHDIMVRVKCEERKTRTGPSKHRKGSHPSASASRLWNGPACHITYHYQGKRALWSWEVRTPFEDTRQAAKDAGATNVGMYALQNLETQLGQDQFPLYLAAEWRQTDRLIHLFREEPNALNRRRLILQLLGPLTSPAVLSTINEATHDSELAMAAISALGDQGEVAIPFLVKKLDSSQHSDHQLAALQALGEIATHSTPPTLYDVFANQLQSPDPRMQTVAVRGLGSLGDLRAVTPIETLNIQAWSNPSTHADMQALREALNWSIYQLDASSSSH